MAFIWGNVISVHPRRAMWVVSLLAVRWSGGATTAVLLWLQVEHDVLV